MTSANAEPVIVPRCTADERRKFERRRINIGTHTIAGFEPAMGTIDQRLSIIVRRLGGRVGPIRSDENINQYRVP